MKMVVHDYVTSYYGHAMLHDYVTSYYGHAMLPHPYYLTITLTIEMRETNKVGHVKLFTNEIEALTHEMNKFGFVTP